MLETLVRHLDMIRLTVPAFALVLVAGCVGTIGNDKSGKPGGPGSPDAGNAAEQTAIADWTTMALPAMQVCTGCHNGQTAGENFLLGTTPAAQRTSLLTFAPLVINLDAPSSSRVLTKGLHNGPALTPDQSTAILTWIEAEQAAAGAGSATTLLETAQMPLSLCTGSAGSCPINSIPLDPVGATGATINFVVQALGSDPSDGIYINQLQLTSGSGGAYINHPLFVSYPAAGGDPVPDSLDRFFDININQMGAGSDVLDGGTAAFLNFTATDPISIIFIGAGPYMAGSGSGSSTTSGCQQLASFKTNAQQPLETNCFSCHGGQNAAATAGMDLTHLEATDDPTILLACDQVLTQLNLTDVANSGFFVEPNPGNTTNHPFKFNGSQTNFNTFMTAVAIWANAEKASP